MSVLPNWSPNLNGYKDECLPSGLHWSLHGLLLELQWKVLPQVLPFVPVRGLDVGILQPWTAPELVMSLSFISEMLFSWRLRGRTVNNCVSVPCQPQDFSLSSHFLPLSAVRSLPFCCFLPWCPFYPWSLVSCHFLLSLLIFFFKPFISILAQMVVRWGWGIPVPI